MLEMLELARKQKANASSLRDPQASVLLFFSHRDISSRQSQNVLHVDCQLQSV